MNIDNRTSNILIVDDNIDNLGLLANLLSDRGYKVRKAINGKIALMGVRAEAPDLILLDILMPDLDGYEVCRQLKSDPNTTAIPVIFLSALDEGDDKVKGFQVGGEDYIAKPFEAEEVLARVEHQLQIQFLQKQLQQQNLQLKEREHRLNTILATMSDGLIVLDRNGNVRFVNPAAPQLLNKTEAELYNCCFEWEIATGETREIEIILTSGDTRILTIDAKNTTWNEASAVLLSIRDITHRKQTEIALKQAKEAAEAANQTKSTFLSSVSHELRTPLHAILGFSTLLAEENLSVEQQENLAIIRKSGEHLQELIEDILFISKIESGLEVLHLTTFDFPQFLNFIHDLFYQEARQKNLQLIWECDANLPQLITCDRSKLRQVLVNLIGNAIEYLEQGNITLRVSNQPENSHYLTVTSDALRSLSEAETSLPKSHQLGNKRPFGFTRGKQTTNKINFEIEDTGSGIAEKDIETLFDPFMQSTGGSQDRQGTSLGLAISQKFVQLMGSQIQVKSTLGKGSIFSFSIPSSPQLSYFETESNSRENITYIYREESKNNNISLQLQKKDLKIMSSKWIEEFHQASLELNTKQMLQLIEEIPRNEISLIQSLQNLVTNFRIDILQELTVT